MRLKDATASEWQIENSSGLNLRQVRVLARDADGTLTEGTLAELAAGGSGRVPRRPFAPVEQGGNACQSAGQSAPRESAGDVAEEMTEEMDVPIWPIRHCVAWRCGQATCGWWPGPMIRFPAWRSSRPLRKS